MATVRVLAAFAAGALAAGAVTFAVAPRRAHADEPSGTGRGADCVDQEKLDRLSVKRNRRGKDPRDFVKARRHEFSAMGGYFVSDLYSGTYIFGGAYTYHMTDEVGVEAAYSYSHDDAEVARAIESGHFTVLSNTYAPVTFASSALVWSPLHGKLRAGGSIVHFDLHMDLGVGVVDSQTSRGAMGMAGFGIKFFAGKAIAFRLDARDHVYRQELLDTRFLVNDVAVTAGVSLFLPLGF